MSDPILKVDGKTMEEWVSLIHENYEWDGRRGTIENIIGVLFGIDWREARDKTWDLIADLDDE